MEAEVCPLLGLADEQGAYLTYPSYENRCYAASPAEAIPLNEQTFFCLGGHNERCPRFQAFHASATASQAGEVPVAAAAAYGAASQGEPEPVLSMSEYEDAGETWDAGAQTPWVDVEQDKTLPPPPPPPYRPPAGSNGQPRRPVWPLLLAAGTLIGVLTICAFLSAGIVGWRALSTQLALRPSSTPIIETSTVVVPGVVVTATPTPASVVIVETPTLLPDVATATAFIATATALAMPTATPTPTENLIFATPTPEFATATPTFFFVTPTPRDTPTLFPTNTPGVTFATATPSWTPFPVVTATPGTPAVPSTLEPYYVSFVAAPTTIDVGMESILTWTVRGVKAIYLDAEPISGPTGSKRVKPTVTTTYVLRIVLSDNSVQEQTQTVTVRIPSPSATPTTTPTATPTAYYAVSFAEDLSITSINGQETSCRTGNGCTLFQVQVRNMGNRPLDYQMTKAADLPVGWGVFFCWGADCEFGNLSPVKTLAVASRDTVSLNYRIPATLTDGQTVVVDVAGLCPQCNNGSSAPVYTKRFTVEVHLPTPTPVPTGTYTATPTSTTTPTSTWTPTATPTFTPTPTATAPA